MSLLAIVVIPRTSFRDIKKYLDYCPTNWTPTFDELGRYGDQHEITLENCASGAFEALRFTITGRTVSPVNTQKWIWGDVETTDPFTTCLVFEYDGDKLNHVYATLSPKSLSLDICAKRSAKATYPAEITAYDTFVPAK